MEKRIVNQLDELMDYVNVSIQKAHLDEDLKIVNDKNKSEALCEEWWEWIVAEWESDNAEVVFVPKEWVIQ